MKRFLVSTILALALATPAAAAGNHGGMGGHSGESHFGGSVIRIHPSGMAGGPVGGPHAFNDHHFRHFHHLHGRGFLIGGDNYDDSYYENQPVWRCLWQRSPGRWRKVCGWFSS
jgi:hypothetical protein